MSLWVDPPAVNAGDVPDAAYLNVWVEDLKHLYDNPPSCRVTNSANTSITAGADTVLTFDTERWDTGGLHSTSTNPGRITITRPGKYLIGANVEWANGTGGTLRKAWIRKNGTTIVAQIATESGAGAGVEHQALAGVVELVQNDYIELLVRQQTPGALNVVSSAQYSPDFFAIKVG